LDNAVKSIEAEIEPGSTISKFQCISDVLSQKVKTFAANQHLSDGLYSVIFTSITMGGRTGRKVHADVRTWMPPSEAADAAGASATNSKASKRKRVDEDAAGGSTIDGLNAKVAELQRRLGASEAKEREAQAKVAELEQRAVASEAKVAELEQRAVASEAVVAELQRRVDAAEAKEREARAMINELEQCLGATEATIDELGAKVADVGAGKTEELKAKVKELEAALVSKEENRQKWIEYGRKVGPKAEAWNRYAGFVYSRKIEDAIGFDYADFEKYFVKTPFEKMANLAKLVGVDVQSIKSYVEIRKKALLACHPDKRKCTPVQEMLFERVCKKLIELPATI
jgi:uncharacterized coiled-coil protein SlyX